MIAWLQSWHCLGVPLQLPPKSRGKQEPWGFINEVEEIHIMLENFEEYLYQGSTKRDLATSTTGAPVLAVAAACSCIDKEGTHETNQES